MNQLDKSIQEKRAFIIQHCLNCEDYFTGVNEKPCKYCFMIENAPKQTKIRVSVLKGILSTK